MPLDPDLRAGHRFHGTTILAVRHRGRVAVGGDGQVTLGNTVVKAGARKVRKLYNGRIVSGFAGTAGDAFTLFVQCEDDSNWAPGIWDWVARERIAAGLDHVS